MSAHIIPPKRPRLSLQIKPVIGVNSRASRAFAYLDPKDPTTFNTLSNAYSGAIDRSAPVACEPMTAINASPEPARDIRLGNQSPIQPHPALLETLATARPISPPGSTPTDFSLPNAMTTTPPLSAGAVDNNDLKIFTFSPSDATPRTFTMPFSPTEPKTPVRIATFNVASPSKQPPYTHPRTLHSILRNSPLPRLGSRSPISPRRQSVRLQDKVSKRVGYNTPLTQTITTNKYTKSHIDLLVEEASPYSPVSAKDDPEVVLDLALAYTGNETRDGGMTPGPFEEMRRRMAGLGSDTPGSPSGIRKRKKKEKKRRWVWTIGQEDDEAEIGGAMAAIKAAEKAGAIAISTPKPLARKVALEQSPEFLSTDLSESESVDIVMSDMSSEISVQDEKVTRPEEMDVDMNTPTLQQPVGRPSLRLRLGPGMIKQTRQGTPILTGGLTRS